MSRGHVPDTFTHVPSVNDGSGILPPVMSDHETTSSKPMPLADARPEFGHIHRVLASQPATRQMQEDARAVLRSAYSAASNA